MSSYPKYIYIFLTHAFDHMLTDQLLESAGLFARLVLVFQEVPMELGQPHITPEYADILQQLRERADTQQVGRWLDWAIRDQSAYQFNPKFLLHRLMYVLLVELRTHAYEHQNTKLFNIADLFHNIPLQLIHTEQTENDGQVMVTWLRERASQRGLTLWLEQEIQDHMKSA